MLCARRGACWAPTASQGIGTPGANGAVLAHAIPGVGEHWFIGVLGRGLSKLDPHLQSSLRKTGDDLIASVRMLPSYFCAGGYDSIEARVEVTHPLNGLGNIFSERLDDNRHFNGEVLGRRAATLTGSNAVVIATAVSTFPLFDDGTNGDLHPDNQYWTAILPGLGRYDGMYQFRCLLDFTVNGCTTQRELVQSVYVDSEASPLTTTQQVITDQPLANGRLTTVRITPRDVYSNMWGPGRIGDVRCDDTNDCALLDVRDNGDGSYDVTVETPSGVAGVRLDAFNAPVDIPVTCPTCPSLAALFLNPVKIEEFQPVTATVVLTGPAPDAGGGGARVYLSSSDPEIAPVPESILVPTGANLVSFVLSNVHGHGTNLVTITARYGSVSQNNRLTIEPRTVTIVPFEIVSIMDNGTLLEIDFVSPYRLERHELDMRSTSIPNDAWMEMQTAVTELQTSVKTRHFSELTHKLKAPGFP